MSPVARFLAENCERVYEEDGRKHFDMFNLKMAEWVRDNWKPWKDDIIVASHPKTGTTWTLEIVRRIIYKDDERIREMSAKMGGMHMYLESGLPKKFEMHDRLPWKRRLFGTHLPVELVNTETIRNVGAKIICTIRNPKDTMVSLFNMKKSLFTRPELIEQECVNDWNAFVERYVSGEESVLMKKGEWFPDHVLGWSKHKSDENILFVVYEDMKKDPKKEIGRIAQFLDVDLTEEELKQIVEVTSFKYMKENAKERLKKSNFFVKGEVGNWKNHFTVAQSELVDQKLAEKLASTDITFTYELSE